MHEVLAQSREYEERLSQAVVQEIGAQADRETITRLTAKVETLKGQLSTASETLAHAAGQTLQLKQDSARIQEELSGARAWVKEEAALCPRLKGR